MEKLELKRVQVNLQVKTEIKVESFEVYEKIKSLIIDIQGLIKEKKYQEAKIICNHALLTYPDNPYFYFLLGKIRFSSEDYVGAERNLTRATQLKGDFTQADYLLKCLRQKQEELSIESKSSANKKKITSTEAILKRSFSNVQEEVLVGKIGPEKRKLELNGLIKELKDDKENKENVSTGLNIHKEREVPFAKRKLFSIGTDYSDENPCRSSQTKSNDGNSKTEETTQTHIPSPSN